MLGHTHRRDKGRLLIFSCECQRAVLLRPAHTALWSDRLDCGLVCYVEHIGTGLEAGQGFWGDALIVVAPEYKGHWNKQPLQLTEWALCSDDKVQRLWENLFFFLSLFPEHINNSVHENLQGKHSRPAE